nr:hypothetical protein [Tanacetum cinerariifolium]
GFKEERKLSYGEQYLQVGNGAQAAVEAIRVFDLVLPSGLVFKSEVEFQLGKNIKALRSDRGGEYLSQEFKDCLKSVVRSLNMVPTKKVDKTPYEIWHGKAPNLSYLKVWGYEAYVNVTQLINSIRDMYGNLFKRDLISQKFSGRDNDLEDEHMDALPSENTSEIQVESESLGSPPELIHVHRSKRTTRAPNHLCLNIEVEDDEVGDLREPANYKAAMLDPDKVVRSKWLYKKKTDMDDIRAIRILIAIAAYYDYEIWQMDVKTAFLNGRLDKDIYMEQPEGYVDPNYLNREKLHTFWELKSTEIDLGG